MHNAEYEINTLLTKEGLGEEFSQFLNDISNGDYLAALEKIEVIAESGNKIAQYNTGVIYEHYDPIVNKNKSAYWYKKSSDHNYAPAQCALAVLDDSDREQGGLEADGELIRRKLIESSAAQGYALGIHKLGLLYWHGIQVPKNISKAKELMEEASSKFTYATMLFECGVFYSSELHDEISAHKYYEKACNENPYTAISLARIYAFGLELPEDVIPDDENREAYWSKFAKEHGYEKEIKEIQEEKQARNQAAMYELERLRERRESANRSSGCFIATAVYGSEEELEVITLKNFRDDVLLRSNLGTAFVKQYYKWSPMVADYLSKRKRMSVVIKYVFLNPFVAILNKLR